MKTDTERKRKYINPLTDFGFKRVFGDEEVLTAFLNDLIEPRSPIKSVSLLNNDVPPEVEHMRGVVYDIRCKTNDGEEFIVEMQNRPQTHISDRVVYYLARAFSSQRTKGRDLRHFGEEEFWADWDYGLRPVYCVFFLNFHAANLKPAPKRTVTFKVEETGETFFDKMHAYLLELPDYRKKQEAECERPIDQWLYNIANLSNMETQKVPFSDRQPAFKKMFSIAEVAKMSPEEAERYNISLDAWRVSYDVYHTAISDGLKAGMEKGMAKGMAKGIAEGMAKGMAKGRAEGLEIGERKGEQKAKVEIAQSLLLSGMPLEQVQKITGLSVEELMRLGGLDK